MTARDIFEYALVELSKVNAPSLMLSEYNYYINKAVSQYINKRYNIYDINQQTTDDLRVLKSTASIPITDDNHIKLNSKRNDHDATYEFTLPDDYLHMLNCVCIYQLSQRYKCYDASDIVEWPAKRLTADSWSQIQKDYYNDPRPWRPYYYIHHKNAKLERPTNPITDNGFGTDPIVEKAAIVNESGEVSDNNGAYKRTINLTNFNPKSVSNVEKNAGLRYGNTSKVRCEIRYGRDNRVYELVEVLIDYIKAPQYIRLTQEQVDMTADTSQILEFPDYVCQEIINELVTLLMERSADPRLQTQPAVSQSIANPAQQQAAPQPQQQRG